MYSCYLFNKTTIFFLIDGTLLVYVIKASFVFLNILNLMIALLLNINAAGG